MSTGSALWVYHGFYLLPPLPTTNASRSTNFVIVLLRNVYICLPLPYIYVDREFIVIVKKKILRNSGALKYWADGGISLWTSGPKWYVVMFNDNVIIVHMDVIGWDLKIPTCLIVFLHFLTCIVVDFHFFGSLHWSAPQMCCTYSAAGEK